MLKKIVTSLNFDNLAPRPKDLGAASEGDLVTKRYNAGSGSRPDPVFVLIFH
jgi:hypothetical protein